MKKTAFKRAVCFALVLIFALPAVVLGENGANGTATDGLALVDPVENTYIGRTQANRLIGQLQFTDLPANDAHRDAVVRSGALEIIRGGARNFRPNAAVTREEAITYALRAAGLSEMAVTLAATHDLPPDTPLSVAWTVGYLQLASTIGMISAADFDAALAEIRTQFTEGAAATTPANNLPNIAMPIIAATFQRTEPATREEVAYYFYRALQFAQPGIFVNNAVGTSLRSFSDWNTVSAAHSAGVEALLRNNVITGQTATTFGPRGTVTRLQMAQIIRNLDSLHYGLLGIERRVGTVADITNEQFTDTGGGTIWRHIHVRRADGGIDILRFTATGSPSPQVAGTLDAVVLRGGAVMGLAGLEISDQIEYLVHPETGTVWYVNVSSQVQTQVFRGRLELIDMENGTMTFRNIEGMVFTFPMSRGLYGTTAEGVDFIRFGNRLDPAADLPRGSFYDVTLVGNVITAIEFIGDPVLIPEHRGLVIDNNPFFGYITILDANRQEQHFTFNHGHIIVHRRQFFDMRDTIGGLHEMFPSVRQHHREVNMEDVMLGDIVVFQVAADDPFRIIELHAAENTTTRYGRVREIRDQGGYFDMLMEFENGRMTWYTFVDGIRVLENGRPVNPNRIQIGDWARIIVNQAVLGPGVMMESVRDINLDTGGHHITAVVTGRLSGFSAAQNTIQLQNARELTPAGWSNNRQLATFNISGPNVQYFHDGRQVTLAQINRYLQRSDATVYMALENHFAGERAVKVSVRSGRDELIRAGEVLSSANHQFNLLELEDMIRTDAGTIVVRNNRLVEPEHIFPSDWVRTSLNGVNPGIAAVVDIAPAPARTGVQIVRARVSQVWPFESFRVETMSILDGLRWNFTPIAREFTIDHDTIFINEGGVTSIDDFLGHTTDSVIGDVFNVVVEGGRAAMVIDAPFTAPIPALPTSPGHLTVRGIIYAIEGDTVRLRDMTVYNAHTGAWGRFSATDPSGTVNTFANTIIVDRNQVIPANRLQVGQQIMAFSPVRRDMVTIAPGLAVDAYIVFVEN